MEHQYFDDVRKYFEPTFKEGPKKEYKIGESTNNRVTNTLQESKEYSRESRRNLSKAGYNNLHSYSKPNAYSVRSQPPKRSNDLFGKF